MAHEVKHDMKNSDMKLAEEEKRVAKEMMPFLIYAAIPVLIIVFIALKWGPSY